MWIWHNGCTFHIKGGVQIAAVALLLAPGVHAAEELRTLPDPTRPYTGQVASGALPVTGPELQSTMISPIFRRAVISGRTYQQGDKIDGAVITNIQSYEVTLKQGGRETRLRLLPRLAR